MNWTGRAKQRQITRIDGFDLVYGKEGEQRCTDRLRDRLVASLLTRWLREPRGALSALSDRHWFEHQLGGISADELHVRLPAE